MLSKGFRENLETINDAVSVDTNLNPTISWTEPHELLHLPGTSNSCDRVALTIALNLCSGVSFLSAKGEGGYSIAGNITLISISLTWRVFQLTVGIFFLRFSSRGFPNNPLVGLMNYRQTSIEKTNIVHLITFTPLTNKSFVFFTDCSFIGGNLEVE